MGGKAKTLGQWIEGGLNKHNREYEYLIPDGYSWESPFKSTFKLSIKCKLHGPFFSSANHHVNLGSRCPKCSAINANNWRMLTLGQWIDAGIKRHNNEYEYIIPSGYSCNTLFKQTARLTIKCSIHGIFLQMACEHVNKGSRCPICSHINRNNYKRMTLQQWIKCGKDKHNDRYDYLVPEGVYANSILKLTDKIAVICHIHGIFFQTVGEHIKKGQGCPLCARISAAKSNTKKLGWWINNGIDIHHNKYQYIIPEGGSIDMPFKGANKLTIVCPIHGVFKQRASSHSNDGAGCPLCVTSKGEIKITEFLKMSCIDYSQQFKLLGSRLKYDFIIPHHNALIEYDGEQHYSPLYHIAMLKSQSKGEAAFTAQQHRDKLKDELAAANGYRLIRIPYWEYDNIEAILTRELGLEPTVAQLSQPLMFDQTNKQHTSLPFH